MKAEEVKGSEVLPALGQTIRGTLRGPPSASVAPPAESGPLVRLSLHGSLEGVGGVITSEVCHLKADISVIPEMQLF